MTQDEIIALNLSEIEKANERIKMLEDKLSAIKQAIAELESQEPFAWAEFDGEGGYRLMLYENNETYAEDWNKTNPNHIGWVEPIYKHPPQRTEQNFCSRCGKRTADLTTIHTCTPPKD